MALKAYNYGFSFRIRLNLQICSINQVSWIHADCLRMNTSELIICPFGYITLKNKFGCFNVNFFLCVGVRAP